MILDADGAIRCLRTVVFEKGADYVYQSGSDGLCFNFRDGEPSCIVGHVFALLGLTAEKAEELGVDGARSVIPSCQVLSQSDFDWNFDNNAAEILNTAQGVQDYGWTWGEALAASERLYAQMVADTR